ncbi:hypothetical protein [Candidatus Uabimicrobium amorphum]|uniref:Uncharacterized protein n=1 Tax=Uabimicrobium amorphum TaxID=2596890 RepID=A0A5S9F5N5_UABAM|nr:hypothetical protein [Candidatus Uabimicrobium amorphum]BBM85452.1 hypothetical protein UABAM_03819 [Candidatus Uabimicrobium amorphum]
MANNNNSFTENVVWQLLLAQIYFSIAMICFMSTDYNPDPVSDGGLIQAATGIILSFVFLYALVHTLHKNNSHRGRWFVCTYVICAYLLRELDFHRRFTDDNVTRLTLYTESNPMIQKIIGGIIMLLVFASFAYILFIGYRFFLQQLMEKTYWIIMMCLWAVLLIGAQVVERAGRERMSTVIEENMELLASGVALLCILFRPSQLRFENTENSEE